VAGLVKQRVPKKRMVVTSLSLVARAKNGDHLETKEEIITVKMMVDPRLIAVPNHK